MSGRRAPGFCDMSQDPGASVYRELLCEGILLEEGKQYELFVNHIDKKPTGMYSDEEC